MSEGIADYMGIDYRRLLQPSTPFRPNVRCNWFWPDISDSITIKDTTNAKYPTHWTSDPYAKMRVWASTLMDIEYITATNPVGGTRFGRDVTVRLMLTSLSYLTSSATAQDYVWAIFQADRDIPEYRGVHLNDLADIFDNRGFFYYNKASGNITSNTTWSQPMLITGDVTVNSGVTLTIKPNSPRIPQTYVFFETTDDRSGGINPSKCEIIVNGTLKADSTTFTGPTKGSWYGIRFTSSSTNSSYLKKCTIKNAYDAISIDSKSPQVYKCFIDDAARYGIFISGSSANPWVQENYIEADIACVYHYNGGNGNCIQNSFRNAYYGAFLLSGSPCYDYCATGRNKFETSLSRNKVQITGGQPYLRPNQYFTIPNSGYYYIRNLGASTIFASNNYWSAYPPSDTYFYGSVDRSNPLASPPTNPSAGPTWSLPKASGDDFLLAFNRAITLFYDGKYPEARATFKELADKFWAREHSSNALNWYMLATEQMEDIGTQLEYLNSVKKDQSAHPNTRFYALKWLLQCELRKGTAEKALQLAAEVEPGSVYDREISLDLAMGLFEYQGNKLAAENVLNKLSQKFKDEDMAEVIDMIRSFFVREGTLKKPLVQIQEAEEPAPVLASFPNPSNASTKISFRTVNPGHVSVVIYNLLGQQVLKLVDRDVEAGRHEVIWDGRDNYGLTVSSGLYLCRLETMDGSKTIKLLLAK